MVVQCLGLGFKSCLCRCVILVKFLNLSEPFWSSSTKWECLFIIDSLRYQMHGILLKIQKDNEHKAVSNVPGP